MKLSVTDKDGQKSDIMVGYIRLSVGLSTATSTNGDINGLQATARSLTGRTISTARIALSMAVGIAAMAVIVVLMYTSILGAIISIGRNPLAKKDVLHGLLIVLFMSAIIGVMAIVVIFLLLK